MKNEELSAQISQAQLQKMLLEIEDLKHKCNKLQRIIAYLPLIATLITVGSLWVGIWTLWMNYKQQQMQVENQETERKQQTNLTFGKSLLEKHLNVYFDTVDVVSTIATTPPESEFRKNAEERFRRLSNGSLILVEDEELNRSKADFADCLDEVERSCAESENTKEAQLERLAQTFASIAKTSLAKQWKIEFNNTYDSRKSPKESIDSTELSKLASEDK